MKLKDNYLIREFNGTVYAVSDEVSLDKKNDPIILNETGRILWQLLLSETDEKSLAEALFSEYDIDRRTAEEDTAKFIEDLRKAKLLTDSE